MASGSASASTVLVHSLKIVLMSSGVVFIAILVATSLPPRLTSASASASDYLPSLWSGIRAWLRPPYLYVVINCIILTIAATSRLHSAHHAPHAEPPPHAPPHSRRQHDVISVLHPHQLSPYDAVTVTEELVGTAGSYYGAVSVKDAADVAVLGAIVEERENDEVIKEEVVVREGPPAAGQGDTWTAAMGTPPTAEVKTRQLLTRQAPVEFLSADRPPATSRFGHHRRPAKATTPVGGKALRRVAKPKKHDTLESTWKAITEGRHVPLTRHLKKSDTWENHGRQINLLDDSDPPPASPVKKSETFRDRTNHTPPPVVPAPRLKKEPSLSHDELNRRVEAFINKFNEDMRLQRQQSIQQFMEKINRAAY